MADPAWLEIFRSYSPDELQKQIDDLKKQVSVYSQQSVGNKSFVKDLAELKGQLSAAIRVQKERSQRDNPGYGIIDFSRV